jgi:hypothetical protein
MDVDPHRIATFVVASIEGSFGLAKGAQSTELLRSNLEVLSSFLETLRRDKASNRHEKASAKRRTRR